MQGQIQTGKLRALATTARARVASLPNVPTVAESGYDVKQEFFGGVVAPAKTPKETIAKLPISSRQRCRRRQSRRSSPSLGFFAGGECGADFTAILRKDYADYGQIIRDANLKMQ